MNHDPLQQFAVWFNQVRDANLPEPNSMALVTSTRTGIPSARIVLLKSFDQQGFVFYTNYGSEKGRHLDENPNVALLFFWPTLERQVRLSGVASRISREESEAYFHSRPVGSQIGAWASKQSEVLASRHELDDRVRALAEQYGEGPVPLPPYWGGYRVWPRAYEFWQARANRLHDRFRYTRRGKQEDWTIERLSP